MALAGRRILVTRAAQQASTLVDLLQARGAEPIVVPSIEIVPPASFAPMDEALTNLSSFDWLIFTSANAVPVFAERASAAALQTAASMRIAVIGAATGRALEPLGLAAACIPPHAVAESLAAALLPHALNAHGKPTRMLLLCAAEPREHLAETLRQAGAELTVAAAYRTQLPPSSVDLLRHALRPESRPIDAATFTSASTVRNLHALLEAAQRELPNNLCRVSIGPVTTLALQEHGWPPHAEASHADIPSLIAALDAALT
jgi:uroporphyrinogen-III synthase